MSVTPPKIPPDPLILTARTPLLILVDGSRTPHLLISEGRVLHDFQQVVGGGIKAEGLIAPLKATKGLQEKRLKPDPLILIAVSYRLLY